MDGRILPIPEVPVPLDVIDGDAPQMRMAPQLVQDCLPFDLGSDGRLGIGRSGVLLEVGIERLQVILRGAATSEVLDRMAFRASWPVGGAGALLAASAAPSGKRFPAVPPSVARHPSRPSR